MLKLLVSSKEKQLSIRFIEVSMLQEWLIMLTKAPYIKCDLYYSIVVESMTIIDIPNNIP